MSRDEYHNEVKPITTKFGLLAGSAGQCWRFKSKLWPRLLFFHLLSSIPPLFSVHLHSMLSILSSEIKVTIKISLWQQYKSLAMRRTNVFAGTSQTSLNRILKQHDDRESLTHEMSYELLYVDLLTLQPSTSPLHVSSAQHQASGHVMTSGSNIQSVSTSYSYTQPLPSDSENSKICWLYEMLRLFPPFKFQPSVINRLSRFSHVLTRFLVRSWHIQDDSKT